MMKYVYILIFMGVMPFVTNAQQSGKDDIVVEGEWKDSHFSSNKTLIGKYYSDGGDFSNPSCF